MLYCIGRVTAGCLLSCLALGAAHADTRDVIGAATYLERIALGPDATLVIALTSSDGAITETRIETSGRQVPLEFTVSGPAGRDLRLQTALFQAGRQIFASGPVKIAAGDDTVDIGPVVLSRFAALGFATRLRCGEKTVELELIDDFARLKVNGLVFDLVADKSASASRFVSPDAQGTWVFTKGNNALISLDGIQMPECVPTVAAGLFPMTARGNEPGWTLAIADGRVVFSGDYGATILQGTLPTPEQNADGLRFTLESGLVFTIADKIHRDDMTGMPSPYTVTVIRGDSTLLGGGGEPASLLWGDWTIETVDASPVAPDAEVTISFSSDGRISGRAACNRYMGGYTVSGEALLFSAIGSTMMACPEPLMKQERALFDALATVTGFDIAEDGGLILTGADSRVVTAQRQTE